MNLAQFHMSPTRLYRLGLTMALGWVGAELMLLVHAPLPWMIGPLLMIAAVSMSGKRMEIPDWLRNGGQVVLGTTMGLYFTPTMMHQVLGMAHWVLLNVVSAWLLGIFGAWLLRKMSGVDAITSYFCMAVGGGAEMTIQAERMGGRVDRVAAAHTVRVVLVVLIIPLVYKLADVHGFDPLFAAQQREVHIPGMLGLLALSGAASLLIARYRFPNVFVITPLLVTAALTGAGVEWSVMPAWLVNVGQLALGVSMGSRFTPEFLRSAPRFLACVLVSLLVMLALAAGYGYVFGLVSGVNPATTILATAPGGVTEMALTAKVLQLGVSMVTVFQVSRMMLLVVLAGPAFRLYKPWFVKPVTPTLP